jgi:hypothetical protein
MRSLDFNFTIYDTKLFNNFRLSLTLCTINTNLTLFGKHSTSRLKDFESPSFKSKKKKIHLVSRSLSSNIHVWRRCRYNDALDETSFDSRVPKWRNYVCPWFLATRVGPLWFRVRAKYSPAAFSRSNWSSASAVSLLHYANWLAE